jgi:SAM-dependent methyltransferase
MSAAIDSCEPELFRELPTLRLDLGCGPRPKEGFEGVDISNTAATLRVDLFRFPFPWQDESVEEIYCGHFLEHLPARDLEERDVDASHLHLVGKDFFFAFMDECWRILKPGGTMIAVVPNARCDRAFQDPTHRRFFVQHTFEYLSAVKRVDGGVAEQVRVDCDFAVKVDPIIHPDTARLLSAMHPEASMRKFNAEWNVVLDWQVTLAKK